MTTKDRFHKMLTDSGMFDRQADEVIELFITDFNEVNSGYRVTWDRPASEYPDAFYAVGFMWLKKTAMRWIDEHLPQAWFRLMFV